MTTRDLQPRRPRSTLHPKGGEEIGRWISRIDLDGFFLVVDYAEERDGRVSHRGHGVFGWDDAKERHTRQGFDWMGGRGYAEPAPGVWKDRHAFRIEPSRDGKDWKPFLEGEYARA